MTFFSDEQNSELRDLFFEGAAELLQSLNEEGLAWEKNAADSGIARRIRRIVHTLKGDSAAAGFPELSEFAHAVEDALSAESVAAHAAEIAELVLRTADAFGSMLDACRKGATPVVDVALLTEIRNLNPAPRESSPPIASTETYSWTEYEQLLIAAAAAGGERLYDVAIDVEAACPGTIALQMVRNVLEQSASIVCISPEEPRETIAALRAVISTERDITWLSKRCLVPGVTKAVVIQPRPVDATAERLMPSARLKPEHPSAKEGPPPASDASKPAKEQKSETPHAIVSENSLRVDSARIDAALNLLGELLIGKSMLAQNVSEFAQCYGRDPLRARFDDSLAFLSRTLSDLQKSIMKIRMVPVEQLFRRFPRTVRDLARACGKDVQLQISGAATDLDKSILDMLAEPLSHIVRNAIDHGIEPPAARTAAGKPETGTVSLNAYHQGNHIVIECSDDGRGIDRERVVARAMEAGVITADDAAQLSVTEALSLVFHPGLSTAAQVTAISGRGVGMDVVKTVLDGMKGSVAIESQLGRGTTFRLKVPLTVAIIKALMFRVAGRVFAVPLSSVVEIARSTESEIHAVDRHEVLTLRGETLPLVRPERLSRGSSAPRAKCFIVVISHNERKFGMIVDSLVGEEELVIKPLDHQLVATEFVGGASILGDGSVVLILNVQAVVSKLGRRLGVSPMGATA